MRVDPRGLVRRLTPTATRLLEAAVGRAHSTQSYEITAEHLLLQLLQCGEEADTALLLRHFRVDRQRLAARVERNLQVLRSGNGGRPVFSESLFQWFEEAWLFASVELGATRLRSGALLAQFILRRQRYTGEPYPELDSIPLEELKRSLEEALQSSAERVEAEPEPSGQPASEAGAANARGGEALARFTQSFTERARAGQIDPIFGRHREVGQLIDILARRRKNNPIIVGEPGVGKTALVEGLALAIVKEEVPQALRGLEVLGLDLGLLQAGAGVRGEFENRLKAVITEVKASPRPIVLFIDEAHTLIGAGGPNGGSDAANLLKPALARGELRTLAATTWAEYKKYFEKDAALERRFQPVKVEEPSEEEALLMLRGLRATYEQAHGVRIRDEALEAAVKLSHRYISGRQLPDKAVDLLDTAAARVKIELSGRPEAVVSLEQQVAALEREREAKQRELAEAVAPDTSALVELEQRLAALRDTLANTQVRWEQERQAVEAYRAAREALSAGESGPEAARLREALAEKATALARVRGEEPLVHAEVDADVVARVVSGWTGVPVGKMRSDTLAAVLDLEARLGARVRGQPAALRTVAETLRIAQAGIRNPETPIGVLLFVGPSGVGKTETALALADCLYGGERFLTTISMSEFQEKHSVSRLIGSPPGYVGYGEGGLLTEAVRQRPYSVVLLDECEKADLEVMNLFYQVFDKGTLTDGEGRATDFRNTVVILTSNLASEQVMRMYEGGAMPSAEEVAAAIRPALSRHFKPALLARMTIVPYAPMSPAVLQEIVQLRLGTLASRLRSVHGIETHFASELVEALVQRCTEAETGARNVEHTLRSSLMPVLSRELLQWLAAGALPRRLSVGLDPAGGWSIVPEDMAAVDSQRECA